jgi:pimeloyl-ACP methyl ester carboxylesterase
MPKVRVDDSLEMVYEVDDFTDPWKNADPILLVHGGLKPKDLYYAWVPTLARHLRVIRPYMRGHWGSTPAPEGYDWTIEGLVSDLKNFMDALGLKKVHYVGESLGGTLGYNFANRYPERLKTLTIANSPGPTLKGHRMSVLLGSLEKAGVADTIDFLFNTHSEETTGTSGMDAWYIAEAKKNPLAASLGYLGAAANLDLNVESFLKNIRVPTLLLTGAEYSSLLTVAEAQHFRDLIPGARLVVIPGVKFIAVVSAPEKCAEEVLRFIKEQPAA